MNIILLKIKWGGLCMLCCLVFAVLALFAVAVIPFVVMFLSSEIFTQAESNTRTHHVTATPIEPRTENHSQRN